MLITATVLSDFINTTFAGFDEAIMTFGHDLHEAAGAILDPLMRFFTFLGDKGWLFILLALVLIVIPKTRKIGLSMALALAIGALVTNVVIKNVVARPRPYVASEQFRAFWEAVWAKPESDFSFPSGHTTGAFSSMTAFFLAGNRKYTWTGLLLAFLVAFSRIYLAVHYPSDVLFGIIFGALSGVVAFFIMKAVYDRSGRVLDSYDAQLWERLFTRKNKKAPDDGSDEQK